MGPSLGSRALLNLLEGFFLAGRLPPYHANLGERLVKAPRVYVRELLSQGLAPTTARLESAVVGVHSG